MAQAPLFEEHASHHGPRHAATMAMQVPLMTRSSYYAGASITMAVDASATYV
jgi:hypothetical protein